MFPSNFILGHSYIDARITRGRFGVKLDEWMSSTVRLRCRSDEHCRRVEVGS